MVSVVLADTNELFIHVPKAAGGSISSVLLARADSVRYAVTDMASAVPCMVQLESQLPRPVSSYQSTACVRNPWDWAVSGYLQVTENKSAFEIQPTFRDFMLGGWRAASKRVYPGKFTNPTAYVAYHTQITQWEHLGGAEGIGKIDHICRFESLQKDLADTGLPLGTLPHIHRSSRGHYSEYFDAELRELVRDTNADLLRMFGYEFEAV